MHAHVVSVDFTDVEVIVENLQDLVPNLKASRGFVAGYWIRLDDAHGMSVAVYGTEDQARAAAPPVGSSMRGVTVTSVQIGEVMASA